MATTTTGTFGSAGTFSTASLSSIVVVLAAAQLVTETLISVFSLVPGLFAIRHFDKILLPTILLFAVLSLALARTFKCDAFSVYASALVPFGALSGVMQGGSPRFFIAHLFAGLMIPACYLVGLNLRVPVSKIVLNTERLANICVWTGIGAFCIFYVFMTFGIIDYPGFNTAVFLLPLCFFLARRNWLLYSLTMFLIVIGGKRIVLLAALLVTVVFVSHVSRRNLTRTVAFSVFAVLVLVLASFMLQPYLLTTSNGGFFNAIFAKWFLLNPFQDEFDLVSATSTRALEIVLASREIARDQLSFLFGLGYGWSFSEIRGPNLATEQLHFVHLSPMNFAAQYGVPLAVLFFLLLWQRVIDINRRIVDRNGQRSTADVLLGYVLAALAWSLGAYVLASVPLLWIVLGLLSSVSHQQHIPRRLEGVNGGGGNR